MTAVTRLVFSLDIDAITARAEAAPACTWEAFTDSAWLDWHADTDDEHDPGDWTWSGRWLAIRDMDWHTGSEDPGPELWQFLATAREDVLALAAEVRRLRARLDKPAARKDAA